MRIERSRFILGTVAGPGSDSVRGANRRMPMCRPGGSVFALPPVCVCAPANSFFSSSRNCSKETKEIGLGEVCGDNDCLPSWSEESASKFNRLNLKRF